MLTGFPANKGHRLKNAPPSLTRRAKKTFQSILIQRIRYITDIPRARKRAHGDRMQILLGQGIQSQVCKARWQTGSVTKCQSVGLVIP